MKNIAIFLGGRLVSIRNDLGLSNLIRLKKIYNPTFFISLNKEVDDITFTTTVRDSLNVTDDRFVSFYTQTPSEMFTFNKMPETNTHNTYSQHKHNNECIKMIDNYQKKNNMKFDLIVKYRSDIDSVNGDVIQLDSPESNTCYIPEGADWRGGLNDQIAYGDFETMYKYCNLVNNIRNLCESGIVFHPETLLLNHIQREGINIKRFYFDYKLLKI
jgi:hypothetical protein